MIIPDLDFITTLLNVRKEDIEKIETVRSGDVFHCLIELRCAKTDCPYCGGRDTYPERNGTAASAAGAAEACPCVSAAGGCRGRGRRAGAEPDAAAGCPGAPPDPARLVHAGGKKTEAGDGLHILIGR